jgi:RNA polymerase sigma-70 factor (ECF subfamily)
LPDFSRPIRHPETDLYNRDVGHNDQTILVQGALNGDADSFSRLCKRYYSAMVAIAYSQLADRDLAEDAAQEALFVAFRDLSKLKKASRFGRWLTRICRNIAGDMAKARAADKLVAIEDCNFVSDDAAEEIAEVEIVRTVIAELPAGAREVIYLRYYNRMTYREISRLLGISQQAVNGRLRRAKKMIAGQLSRRASVKVNL